MKELASRPARFWTGMWLVPFLLALAFAGYIYFGMPHERMLSSVGMLLFKLIPFFLVSLAIAWFPQQIPTPWKLVLVSATLLPFLGFLVPRELHLAMEGYNMGLGMDPATADPTPLVDMFSEFYTVMAILVPYVILMMAFAYRCGGGSAGNSLKISWAGILLMLSGYEDIMFWVANARGSFPDVATWASHVTVFLGRPATRTEFYIFVAAHLVLIAILLALPLDRIGARLGRALRIPISSQVSDAKDAEVARQKITT